MSAHLIKKPHPAFLERKLTVQKNALTQEFFLEGMESFSFHEISELISLLQTIQVTNYFEQPEHKV